MPGTVPNEHASGAAGECAECGSPLAAGARFCRRCGTAVAPACPACGTTYSPPQRFCRSCGAGLTEPAAAAAAPAGTTAASRDPATSHASADPPSTVVAPARSGRLSTTPAPDPPAPARGRRPLVAGLLAVTLLAAGGGGAALLLAGRDTDGPTAGTGSSTPTFTATSTATVGGPGVTATTPPVPPNDSIEAGRYVQLGSFRNASPAETEARRLRSKGLDAEVYDSNVVAQLQPAFFVILAGPFASATGEDRAVGRARRAGIEGARRHSLEPAVQTAPPSGRYEGELTRKAPADPSLNRTIDATMDFDAAGRIATMRFAGPQCSGDLVLSGTHIAVRSYDETITSGSCVSGGTWSVKPLGSELRVTWWHPDRRYFVIGTLTGG